MIEALRQWLTAIITTTMLLSLAQSLMPADSIRKCASFIGGLILLAVLLRPLADWDAGSWRFPDYETKTEQIRQTLEDDGRDAMETRIAELTAAYISDKAEALGCSGEADVETRVGAEGVPLPWSVRLTCRYSAELSEWMERELDIPAERQVWYGQEG